MKYTKFLTRQILIWIMLFITAPFAGVSWILSWVFQIPAWIFDKIVSWWYYETKTFNASMAYYRKIKSND